jgi:hypothetical protein
VTTISYLVFALIAGACVVRDATGDFSVPDWAVNDTAATTEYILGNFQNCTIFKEYFNETEYELSGCKWGLMNSFQVSL